MGKKVCDKLVKGDWIGVELNMKEGTLHFSINGGTPYPGFQNPSIFMKDDFIPCFTLYKSSIKILEKKN
jgi:hypothetical protein